MSLIIAMCLFALSMSASPGPVNVIALSAGVNYGYKKSVPFIVGASVGFTLLLAVIGISAGALLVENKYFLMTLSVIGSGFIAYMGFCILRASPTVKTQHGELPGFVKGFVLQWLNPKAWVSCLAGVTAFNAFGFNPILMLFLSLYLVICYLSISFWSMLGEKINLILKTEKRLKILNVIMGSCLVLVSLYLAYSQIINI